MARPGQHSEDVALVGRVHGVERRLLRIPEAKPVVVLGRDAEVLHSRFLHQIEPRVGIELHGVPLLGELDKFGARHTGSPLVLLVPGGDRVETPMHEHAETLLKEPISPVAKPLDPPRGFAHPGGTLGLRADKPRRGNSRRPGHSCQTAEEESAMHAVHPAFPTVREAPFLNQAASSSWYPSSRTGPTASIRCG